MRSTAFLLAATVLLAGCGSNPPAPTPKPTSSDAGVPTPPTFAKDIKPLLASRCLPCHSGTPEAKSGYDVTTHSGVLTKVVPGKAGASVLYTTLESGRMPPSGKLDAASLAEVKDWIDAGARGE